VRRESRFRRERRIALPSCEALVLCITMRPFGRDVVAVEAAMVV
jgi:hypothetical protein